MLPNHDRLYRERPAHAATSYGRKWSQKSLPRGRAPPGGVVFDPHRRGFYRLHYPQLRNVGARKCIVGFKTWAPAFFPACIRCRKVRQLIIFTGRSMSKYKNHGKITHNGHSLHGTLDSPNIEVLKSFSRWVNRHAKKPGSSEQHYLMPVVVNCLR